MGKEYFSLYYSMVVIYNINFFFCFRFKIWHYTCVLLHETMWPTGEELLSVCWQTFPRGTFKESVLNNTKVQGIQPSQPIASKQAYR